MLKKKPFIQDHKKLAENKLLARMEVLKSKGMTKEQIQKDAVVKHHKAAIREAGYQLAQIEKLEMQIAQKAEIKAEKLAAPKVARLRPKRSAAPDPLKKKAKKERKIAAEVEE